MEGPTLLVILAGWFALLFLLWRTRGSRNKEPPLYKTDLPILGPAKEFRKAPDALVLQGQKKYGNAFRVNLIARQFTFVLGPEANRWFFGDDELLSFTAAVAELVGHMFSQVMFERKDWHPVGRKAVIAGMMMPQRLQQYAQIIQEEVDSRFQEWAKMDFLDLFRECSRLAMAVNVRCLLGQEAYEQYPELCDLYYEFESMAALPEVAMLPWLPLKATRRFHLLKAQVTGIIKEVVKHRLATVNQTRGQPDYLQLVLEMAPDFADVIPDHILSFLFAGHVNTLGTMAWTIAHIANDRKLQNAIRMEVQEEGRSPEAQATAALAASSNKELKLLEKCMRETNRKYAICFLVRKATRDTPFNNYFISKGSTVAFSPYALHMNEQIYPNPFSYQPERFTKSKVETWLNNKEYVPFGAGVHACMGQRFVTLVLRTSWISLFGSYNIELLDTDLPPPEYFGAIGTPGPTKPVRVRLRAIP